MRDFRWGQSRGYSGDSASTCSTTGRRLWFWLFRFCLDAKSTQESLPKLSGVAFKWSGRGQWCRGCWDDSPLSTQLYSLFVFIFSGNYCNYFWTAGLVHRKKGVIEKWHGPWCHLTVNAVSVQQFRSVEVAGSLGVFGPRVPTLQRRWGLDFCQLLDSQDLWLKTRFQWFLGTRTYFLQNPKRRLIFSVLNESNSVEPEDRCSVRVDTDDECDAQFCTKFGCCHYSMLYTVTTQESLASLFLYENLLTFRPSDHPFCKFRPWLACQCKAAHCVEQCAYMWRQWPTSGPHQTCASVFFAWKSRKSDSRDFRSIQGEFSWLQRGLATVSPFPPWFSFFSASSSRARLGAAD